MLAFVFVLIFLAFSGVDATILIPIALVGASLSSFIIARAQVQIIDTLKLDFAHWVILTVVGFSSGILFAIIFQLILLLIESRIHLSGFAFSLIVGSLALLPGLFTGIAQQFQLPANYNKTAWILLSMVEWLLPLLFILPLNAVDDIQSRIPYATEDFLAYALLAFAVLGSGSAIVGMTYAYIKRQQRVPELG